VVALLPTFAGGSVAGAAPAHAPAMTQSELESKLLQPSQLPGGWAIYPQSKSTSKVGGCLAGVKHPRLGKGSLTTSASYTDGVSQILTENLQYGSVAPSTYRRGAKALAHCHSVSVTSGGQKIVGKVTRLTFPKITATSVAYAVLFKVTGQTAGVDLVLFRVGKFGGDFVLEYPGRPSVPELAAIVRVALSDMNTVTGAPSRAV
jgi:hypothetical protein